MGWAHSGQSCNQELAFTEAFETLLSKLEPFGINVACVTYPTLDPKVMIVTRRAPW